MGEGSPSLPLSCQKHCMDLLPIQFFVSGPHRPGGSIQKNGLVRGKKVTDFSWREEMGADSCFPDVCALLHFQSLSGPEIGQGKDTDVDPAVPPDDTGSLAYHPFPVIQQGMAENVDKENCVKRFIGKWHQCCIGADNMHVIHPGDERTADRECWAGMIQTDRDRGETGSPCQSKCTKCPAVPAPDVKETFTRQNFGIILCDSSEDAPPSRVFPVPGMAEAVFHCIVHSCCKSEVNRLENDQKY